MQPVTHCLNSIMLENLGRGYCQEPLLSWYLWHIEGCSDCSERIAEFLSGDSVSTRFTDMTSAVLSNDSPEQVADPSNDGINGSSYELQQIQESVQRMIPGIAMPQFSPACEPDEIGRFNDFRVHKLIGTGNFALVFEAEDLWLNRKVALKVLRHDLNNGETGRFLFLAEAKAIASIQHDHVVPILHIGQYGNEFYIVMPLLNGESLKSAIETRKFSLNYALKILRDCASGLAAAHDSGLIHCDLKPNNIWLVKNDDGTEKAVLLDFGLTALNSVNLVAGTPGFMAPEQIEGVNVSPKTDIFGLGCLLLAMMHPHYALKHKQSELTPEESLIFQQSIRPVLPLLNWLLAPNPENRPADARKVVQWIDGYLGKSQPVIKNVGLKRWVGRAAVLALFLTVAFLAQSYSKLSSISGFASKAHDSKIKTLPENAGNGEEVASIDLSGLTPHHSIALEEMTKLSISDNGEYGLFLSPKRAVELRSMADFSIISEWDLNDYPTEMVITNSGNYAAFSSPDGEIEIWLCGTKYPEGELANITQISTDTLRDLSWSDEEKPRLAAIHGNNLSIINPHKAPASQEFLVTDRLPYEPHQILWRPGHNEIVCTITDGGIIVWDPEDRNPVSGLRAHMMGLVEIVSDPHGHFFYSTAADKHLVKYDAEKIMSHQDLGLVPSWSIVYRVATQSMVRNLTYLDDDQLAVLVVQRNEGQLLNQLCLLKAGSQSKMIPFSQMKFEISELITSNSREFFFLRSTDHKLYVFEMSEIKKHLETNSSSF